ncbi:MAG: hypothetical protein EYC70_15980 [Planctomycetota bacterium]|nr:MAG: hypothetical protein EYC70_15980 [Planctomycetota bacterium]
MKPALLLGCLIPQSGGGADEAAAAHAFLEVVSPHSAYFVHEPVQVRLRFGFDPEFFASHALQLSPRRLDVPAHVQAPWLEDLPGAVLLDPGADETAAGPRLSFALNDGVAEAAPVAERAPDGRTFTVLEIRRSFLPAGAGELVIPGPLLRFAHATRFHDDLVNGRVPADRREALVRGAPLTLTIRPLPEEGRPPEFSGAVGRFTLQAEARPRALALGDTLQLLLHIEGQGNLAFFEPPRLEPLEGFHVYGLIDDRGATRRTITYDLVPLRPDVVEVPPIRFAFFDPQAPDGYHSVHTEPIPIRVGPPPAGTPAELPATGAAAGTVPGENDIYDIKPAASGPRQAAARRLSPALLVIVLLLPWPLALGLWSWMCAHERRRSDPAGVRARHAADRFRADLDRPQADPAAALAEFLAARLRCPAAAVITPDLPERLMHAGVPAGLAARAAALLDALVAARYGAAATPQSAAQARALVGELEDAFQSAERSA